RAADPSGNGVGRSAERAWNRLCRPVNRRSADTSGGCSRGGGLSGALAIPDWWRETRGAPRARARPLIHWTPPWSSSDRVRVSTRRFWARPSGVAFDAVGRVFLWQQLWQWRHRLYRHAGRSQEGQEYLHTSTTMYRDMDIRCCLERAEAELS